MEEESSVDNILGGGIVADVILWRKRNITVGMLLGTLAAWTVFEISGYTLVSFVSNVLLLLFSLLFVWAKSAQLLNRRSPPIVELHLGEEFVTKAAISFHARVNTVLAASHNIALGKDSILLYKVASCLLLFSVVGSWTDSRSLGYMSLVIIVTVPALYEKYEDNTGRYVMFAHVKLQVYERVCKCFCKVKWWILDKLKES